MEDDDPLAPARGFINGILLAAVTYGAIGLAWWWLS